MRYKVFLNFYVIILGFTQYYFKKLVSSTNKILTILWLVTIAFSFNSDAQTTVYTQLYNSSNFTKTIDLSKPVGEIKGSISQSASGGVTYSFPIFTPPGTNGLQPSLALSYNSQSLKGSAGLGWDISGLSIITRSGKDIFHNGIVNPVKYTSFDDAFLLDGIHLNVVSGSNGSNLSEYATESETYSKIISYTTGSSNNPDWFKVIIKDGSIMEFGNSADSRVLTDNGLNVIYWRINKIIDVSGNYIEFKYDNTNRESRIQQILYTGNSSTGLVPYNQVNFSYSLRDDANTEYIGGASMATKYLLNKISVIHTNDLGNNEIVKTYRLNYGFDNIHSKLKEFEEFGGDENSPSLNSTIFLYGDDVQDFNYNTESLLGNGQDLSTGDFDGDGKTDVLAAQFSYGLYGAKYYTGYSIYNNLDGNGVGNYIYGTTFSAPGLLSGVTNNPLAGFASGDFNKDGRDDVVFLSGQLVEYGQSFLIDSVVINTTGSFNPQTGSTAIGSLRYPTPVASDGYYQLTSSNGKNFIPGDYTGDGNSDYILIARNNVTGNYKAFITSPSTNEVNKEILNFGIGTNSNPNSYAQTISEADEIIPIDFDGDGKLELFIIKNDMSYVLSISRVAPSTGYNFQASIIYTTLTINKNCRPYAGDFNGDGKTDFLTHYDNNTWGLLYSNGVAYDDASAFYFQDYIHTYGYDVTDRITVADFNGDGKSDILHGYNYSGNTSKLSFYYCRGKESSTPFYYEQYTFNRGLSNVEFLTGDLNADGKIDLINRFASASDILYIKPFSQKNLLSKITTGHNVTTSFDYKLLTDKNSYPYFYNRTISLDDPANISPFNYVQLPMYALSTITTPDGISGDNITEFNYEDAVVNRSGKGFLGFKKITSKNNITGITSVSQSEINTQFAVPYPVRSTSFLTNSAVQISESTITNSFIDLTSNTGIRYLQHVDKTLSVDYVNNKAVEQTNTFDNYNNITASTSKIGYLTGATLNTIETASTTTSYGIHNSFVPVKPDYTTITNTRAGSSPISISKSFTYTPVGLLATQTDYDGLPNSITTSYSYNNFGNPISIALTTPGQSSRTATNIYDSKGRFIIQKHLAAGTAISQTESYIFDTKWGVPISTTSSDCLTSTFTYDAFGRLNQTTRPDGTVASYNSTFLDYLGTLYVNSTYYSGGAPPITEYMDKYGRTWKTTTPGPVTMFPRSAHTVITTFDNRGNIKTKTNSFFPNIETPRITTYDYDNLNRAVSTVNDIGTATIAYSQLGNGNTQLTSTNASGQVASKITDATGKVISTQDDGGQLSFSYDSHGNQITVIHDGTTLVNSVFDVYDRQLTLADKDAGTISYTYDGYGQLTQQTDANGNSHSSTYDELGRVTSYTGPEGQIINEYYNDINTGCRNNNLSRITNFNGIVKEYTYDNLKRLASEKQTIDGADYITSYGYSNNSEVISTTYPSGFVLQRDYDIRGNLLRVYSGANVFFSEGTIDGEHRYKTYKLLSGSTTTNTYNKDYPLTTTTAGIQDLTYNFQVNTGNLLQRTDNLNNQNEIFTYDNLNRLISSTVNGTQQFGITYDGSVGNSTMGNIVSKTDAGYYKYRNDKIHAVAYTMETPVPGQSAVFPTPVSVIPHPLQHITYTPFLKPASITENNLQLDFTYGSNHERVKTTLTDNGNLSETKYFIGDYEKTIRGRTIKEVHYVSGGNGLCGIVVIENGAVPKYYSTYTDYLGSITCVTDATAATDVRALVQQNFDSWGRQREPSNWNTYITSGSMTAYTPDWLYRGFTGHEMLSQFSLINMNGRIYDPLIGRMISPDNYVSNPNSTQGYNRYSYANNNPLVYTDPDGNCGILAVMAIFAAVHVSADLIRSDFHMSFNDIVGSALIGGLQGAMAGIGPGAITKGGTALVAAISGELPSANVQVAPGLSVGLSPAVSFGSTGWSIGANFNVSANVDGVEFGWGVGASYGRDAVTHKTGISSRVSSMLGLNIGGASFGIGNNMFYSGNTSQQVAIVHGGYGPFQAQYENDYLWGKAHVGDGNDRFRTTAASVSYKNIGVGLQLFTGEIALNPISGRRDKCTLDDGAEQYIETSSTNQYRLGAMYLSYGNYRLGGNSEGIRNYWQNHVAHKDGFAHAIFQVLDIKPSLYFSYQTQNPFTIWAR